ncbi:MAG: hypothetical protein Q7S71_06075, partial [Candidatus Nitrotoga sp.]|nr:hypothetical protein [Candidatus Nitrotoga sp.]
HVAVASLTTLDVCSCWSILVGVLWVLGGALFTSLLATTHRWPTRLSCTNTSLNLTCKGSDTAPDD